MDSLECLFCYAGWTVAVEGEKVLHCWRVEGRLDRSSERMEAALG